MLTREVIFKEAVNPENLIFSQFVFSELSLDNYRICNWNINTENLKAGRILSSKND